MGPPKTIAGTILDKFGVRGVFECCKGTKVSQRRAARALCKIAAESPLNLLTSRVDIATESQRFQIAAISNR